MGAKSNFLGQWKFLFWLSVLLFFHLYIWKKLNTGKQKENEICACGEGWLCHDNSLCLILLSSPSLNILVLWLLFFFFNLLCISWSGMFSSVSSRPHSEKRRFFFVQSNFISFSICEGPISQVLYSMLRVRNLSFAQVHSPFQASWNACNHVNTGTVAFQPSRVNPEKGQILIQDQGWK